MLEMIFPCAILSLFAPLYAVLVERAKRVIYSGFSDVSCAIDVVGFCTREGFTWDQILVLCISFTSIQPVVNGEESFKHDNFCCSFEVKCWIFNYLSIFPSVQNVEL